MANFFYAIYFNFVLMLQFNAILCLCYNLMQFCAYVAIQCNFAIISAIFLKKKGFGLIFHAI